MLRVKWKKIISIVWEKIFQMGDFKAELNFEMEMG